MNLQEASRRIERLEEEIETLKVQREQTLLKFKKVNELLIEIRDSLEAYFDVC